MRKHLISRLQEEQFSERRVDIEDNKNRHEVQLEASVSLCGSTGINGTTRIMRARERAGPTESHARRGRGLAASTWPPVIGLGDATV